MANIITLFGILFILSITYPALLTFVWLMWPAAVIRSHDCLKRSMSRCFWIGLIITLITGIGVAVLLASPSGVSQLLGWTALVLMLALACRGASALVLHLAQRSGMPPDANAFFRRALMIELAAAFPVIGWVIVLPFTLCVGIGATCLALRSPRNIASTVTQTLPTP